MNFLLGFKLDFFRFRTRFHPCAGGDAPVQEQLHLSPALVAAEHARALPALLLARAHMRPGRNAELR